MARAELAGFVVERALSVAIQIVDVAEIDERVNLGQLNQLERDVERAQARTRRQAARLLRDASHRLGHLEAQGERNWRKLNARARRETLAVLRRLERAVEQSGRGGLRKKKTAKKKTKAAPRKAPARA